MRYLFSVFLLICFYSIVFVGASDDSTNDNEGLFVFEYDNLICPSAIKTNTGSLLKKILICNGEKFNASNR